MNQNFHVTRFSIYHTNLRLIPCTFVPLEIKTQTIITSIQEINILIFPTTNIYFPDFFCIQITNNQFILNYVFIAG